MQTDYSDVAIEKEHEPQALPPKGNAVTVEPLIWTVTNEAPIRLFPTLAVKFKLVPGVFLSQLAYWSEKSTKHVEGRKVVRHSYTRWQRQLAFLSRSQIFNIVRDLEKRDAILVLREGVIRIAAKITLKPVAHEEQNLKAAILVFPTLAKVVGLREALAIQQVHVRTYHDTMRSWTPKSIRRWHTDCLMFIPIPTLKAVFTKLLDDELLCAKRVDGPGGGVNAYKVNYDKLKARMAGQTTMNPVIDWNNSMTDVEPGHKPYLLEAKAAGKPIHWDDQQAYGGIKYMKKAS